MLVSAVSAGQVDVVELLLRGASPAVLGLQGADGLTALHTAVRQNKPDMVDMLLNAGADANVLGGEGGVSPLMLCTNADIARRLLAKGARVGLTNSQGENALMLACRRGDGATAALLLEHQADVAAANARGWTALLMGCEQRHFDLVPVLLRARAESSAWLDAQSEDGSTAISIAADWGNARAVQALVDAGADVHLSNAFRNPLQRTQNLATARVLLNAGAKDTLSPNGWVENALIRACRSGNLPLAELLLEHKSDVNAKTSLSTPLIAVAERGHLNVINTLLAADPPALVDGRDLGGRTALAHAAAADQPLALQALLTAGADALLASTSGATALMEAASPACVKLLVEAAPEAMNMVDKQGGTALMRWCRSKDKKMLSLIQELFSSCETLRVSVDVNKRNAKGHSALDEALSVTNHPAVDLLMTRGVRLGGTTAIKPFQRVRRSKNADRNINTCLGTVLQHSLATGRFEQPTAPRPAKREDVEEEEPVKKRKK
jgi:ankyrin repeat protein